MCIVLVVPHALFPNLVAEGHADLMLLAKVRNYSPYKSSEKKLFPKVKLKYFTCT
jgi:hypothetical protein